MDLIMNLSKQEIWMVAKQKASEPIGTEAIYFIRVVLFSKQQAACQAIIS